VLFFNDSRIVHRITFENENFNTNGAQLKFIQINRFTAEFCYPNKINGIRIIKVPSKNRSSRKDLLSDIIKKIQSVNTKRLLDNTL
jgi:hypothetical protein